MSLFSSYGIRFSFSNANALTITKEKQQEMVDICLSEDSDMSEEECEENIAGQIEKLDKEIVALDGSQHGTTTSEDWAMFAGALITAISYILTACKFWSYYWPKPSFWMGLGASLVMIFWYFGALVMFSDYTTQMDMATSIEIDKLEDMTVGEGTDINLEMGITNQIDALEKAADSVDNFKNALKTAEILSYSGVGFAILECSLCWLIQSWCHKPQPSKKNLHPLFKIIQSILFPTAKAELADKELEKAKEESGADGVGFDINSWLENIAKIGAIVFVTVGKNTIEKAAEKAIKKGASYTLCALRAGFLLWDGINYSLIHGSWDDAKTELKKRIDQLKKALAVIRSSIQKSDSSLSNNNTNNNQNNSNGPTTPDLALNQNDNNLGGACIDADMETGDSSIESTDKACEDNDFKIPTEPFENIARKTQKIFPQASSLVDDTLGDLESIEDGLNTTASVDINKSDRLAKVKGLIPKLLELKRKIEKDKKLAPSESLLDKFFEAGKLRTEQNNSFAKALRESGINPESSFASLSKNNSKKDSESASSKRKVNDDKKFELPKSYNLDDSEVLKRKRNKKSTDKLRSDALSKYKIKHDDIVKKKGVSIWKLINSRYLKSGYSRLFDQK